MQWNTSHLFFWPRGNLHTPAFQAGNTMITDGACGTKVHGYFIDFGIICEPLQTYPDGTLDYCIRAIMTKASIIPVGASKALSGYNNKNKI